jgi:hypothetical protein
MVQTRVVGRKPSNRSSLRFALTLDGERTQFQASSSASFFEARYAMMSSVVDTASSYVAGFQSSDVYV